MYMTFFFDPAGAARGAAGYQEAEQPSAERMEYADVDFLLGLVKPKPCFSLPQWMKVGW